MLIVVSIAGGIAAIVGFSIILRERMKAKEIV